MKKILTGAVLAFALLIPAFSFALMTTIAPEGDYNPNETQTDCVALQNNLGYRMRDAQTNDEVSLLQDFLISRGTLSGEATGYFGLATLTAVKKLQQSIGLQSTGYVGPFTRGKIKAMTCGATTPTTLNKINWVIEKAYPNITESNDNRQYEQAIAIDVTFADNSTKRYSLGTAYGCTGSTVLSVENGKTVLGKINCYFSLAGVGFVAYSQDGRLTIERHEESARDGSIKTTVLLTLQGSRVLVPGCTAGTLFSATTGLLCAGITITSPITSYTANFVVTPMSGSAPLTVNFKGRIDVPTNQSGRAIIFFGDGVSDLVFRFGPTLFTEDWTHTYNKPGEYDAYLVLSSVSDIDRDIEALRNPHYYKNTIVKKIRISVGGQSAPGCTTGALFSATTGRSCGRP